MSEEVVENDIIENAFARLSDVFCKLVSAAVWEVRS